ncbi:hypothetical protein Q7C36_002467 [Tachysurus vachellii]|uniref:Uncharacterized protein n=1 Tax=Tachysurus vachellii TaxID=175792 RepID=A0AA88NUI4_TACVA|nr:hypothetical protein Q7C36_002467 [Tachysurus vachellii]
MRVVKTCSSVRELIGKGEILQVIVGYSRQVDYNNIKQIYGNKILFQDRDCRMLLEYRLDISGSFIPKLFMH